MTNFMVGFQEIPGFLDYHVTELGDVYSTKYGDYRKLKPSLNNAGYLKVGLSRNDIVNYVDVHRLVALTFLNLESGMVVNHINGIKTDNRLDNLEVCTHLENVRHGFKIGLSNQTGESHSQVKLSNSEVILIKELLKDGKLTQKILGEMFGVCSATIGNINTGRAWGHIQ